MIVYGRNPHTSASLELEQATRQPQVGAAHGNDVNHYREPTWGLRIVARIIECPIRSPVSRSNAATAGSRRSAELAFVGAEMNWMILQRSVRPRASLIALIPQANVGTLFKLKLRRAPAGPGRKTNVVDRACHKPDVAEAPPGHWSNLLVVDKVAYFSRLTARAKDQTTIEGRDEYEQTKIIFGKFKACCRRRAAPWRDMVQLTIFVTNIKNREGVWKARREFFKGDFPACALVEVASLASAEVLVEIQGIAILEPERSKPLLYNKMIDLTFPRDFTMMASSNLTLISRRACLAAPLAIVCGRGARAAGYPSRPVTLIVPYAAGGTADILARVIAQSLQETLSQPFIVETIAATAIAHAANDGYSLLFTAGGPITIGPNLSKQSSYNASTGFSPIALIGQVPSFLAVNAQNPIKTLAELAEAAKARPGALKYASPGVGTSVHLMAELFRLEAGIEVIHVPYRGGGPAMNDLLGGQVDYMIENVPQLLPQVLAGSLRALAVTSSHRLASAPDVPTFAESGIPGLEMGTWFGLLGPSRLPPDVIILWSKRPRRRCRTTL